MKKNIFVDLVLVIRKNSVRVVAAVVTCRLTTWKLCRKQWIFSLLYFLFFGNFAISLSVWVCERTQTMGHMAAPGKCKLTCARTKPLLLNFHNDQCCVSTSTSIENTYLLAFIRNKHHSKNPRLQFICGVREMFEENPSLLRIFLFLNFQIQGDLFPAKLLLICIVRVRALRWLCLCESRYRTLSFRRARASRTLQSTEWPTVVWIWVKKQEFP